VAAARPPSSLTTDTWRFEQHEGTAAAFHARPVPDRASRAVWALDPTGPALVLGSAQLPSVADADACAAAGVDVVRRRSGGGAVLLQPDDVTWVDVLLPVGDPLWDDDVGRAFLWLGDAWAVALATLGVSADVHRGRMLRTPWSDLVCFAGLGPGEICSGDRKILGISQRRTRGGARFQCALLHHWDAAATVALLALEPDERARAATELALVAAGVDVSPTDVLDALLDALP
jgi:lipoate-protein ligase A